MLPYSRIAILIAIFFAFHPTKASAADTSGWSGVTYKVTRDSSYNPCPLTIRAEQANLETKTVRDTKWWGYGGPVNIHTRRLSFVANKDRFDIPDGFVTDLLNLRINGPSHVSLDGDNTVLTMRGSDGEKGYIVHFHFDGSRFVQRILEYSEARDVYIKTNS